MTFCRGFFDIRQLFAAFFVFFSMLAGNPAVAAPRHGIAMHGEPALPPDFKHLPYTNPAAPKGGRFIQAIDGSFDSLNPLIIKGNAPPAMVPYVVQPLMLRSLDEPFTLYGLVAETVETPPDRTWVEFKINPKARFSDGHKLTAADIAFSWELLRDHGRPAQRGTYSQVLRVETPDEQTVRFVLDGSNYELPLLLGLMPVFAKHATDAEKFEEPGFTMPLGSGPYTLGEINPGSSLTLKRNPEFWGNDLPILSGMYNFDELKLDFYRDPNAMFEGFKSQLYDYRVETSTAKWLTGYNFKAVADGAIVRESFRFITPKPMTGFVFNTRKEIFADIRVREALTFLFDFEWLNRNIFAGLYQRTGSYFEASELSARERPASDAEKSLLAPYKDEIRPDILDGSFAFPKSDGTGRDRAMIQKASALLKAAGYQLKNGVMISDTGGRPLTFEIIVTSREKLQIAAAFGDTLKLLGIKPQIRLIDSSQYWSRLRAFDYDMILESYVNSPSPGTEQFNRWSGRSAEREASLNYAGVRSKAVDNMLLALQAAHGLDEFVTAVRALDRALLSGFYIIPLYFAPERWVARNMRIARPERTPGFDLAPDTWWRANPK